MTDEELKVLARRYAEMPSGKFFSIVTVGQVNELAKGYLALSARIAEVEAVLDEVAAPDPDGKPLAQRVRDELADFHMVIDHASKVFCHVTDGAIGKVNTLPSVVCAVADDVTTALVDEAVKEARAEWEAELGDPMPACPGCDDPYGHLISDGTWHCNICMKTFDAPAYWYRVKAPA